MGNLQNIARARDPSILVIDSNHLTIGRVSDRKSDDIVSEGRVDKACARCGRRITYRKKWARTWDQVRYCSDGCRAAMITPRDSELEITIGALLDQRGAGKTICPSDAARAIGGESWRDLMEPARQAARRMVARGDVVITQHGRVVDPSTAKGAVRIRRA